MYERELGLAKKPQELQKKQGKSTELQRQGEKPRAGSIVGAEIENDLVNDLSSGV